MINPTLQFIKSQITNANNELTHYKPDSIDWLECSIKSSELLIPWLIEIATDLKKYVQEVLNAPQLLRDKWSKLKPHFKSSKKLIDEFEKLLSLDDVLRESITGELVSNVISNYLINNTTGFPLSSNGRSDYPDLFISNKDYIKLPAFQKSNANHATEYGASLKGIDRRPVRVPDGLEIKTCRDRIAVDCHHPHVGLHLVVLFSKTKNIYVVDDIKIAFLQSSDYRESRRNTTATTVKYSFTGERFISILLSKKQ